MLLYHGACALEAVWEGETKEVGISLKTACLAVCAAGALDCTCHARCPVESSQLAMTWGC